MRIRLWRRMTLSLRRRPGGGFMAHVGKNGYNRTAFSRSRIVCLAVVIAWLIRREVKRKWL